MLGGTHRTFLQIVFAFFIALNWYGTVAADPSPSVTLDIDEPVFIGEDPIDLSVTFNNSAPSGAGNIGYGPFIDLYLPATGADGDDGVTFVNGSASYLGIAITTEVLTFPPDISGTSCVNHPYAENTVPEPVEVCGTPGDQLVVFQLPFGSFTPDQPAVEIDFQVSLSDYADLGYTLPLYARGGFQFGLTPLDDPCCDPSFFDDSTPGTMTDNPVGAIDPVLMELTKTNTPPESEVATGPNFPHRYTVEVEIADGQTVTNLDIVDYIDDNIIITGVTASGASVTFGGNPVPPYPTQPVNADGVSNELIVTYPSASGTVSFAVDYYVPLQDAAGANIVTAANGATSTTENRAYGVGDWNPSDPRDAGAVDNAFAGDVTCPACPPTVTHTNQALAIQKSADNTNPRPGDVVTYTYTGQVSDFFALDNVRIYDVISDGQRLTADPVLTFTQHGTTTTNQTITNFAVREYFSGGSPGTGNLNDPEAGTVQIGSSVLSIDLSAEWGGFLLGGCVPVGGTGGGDPDCGTFDGDSTTFSITYQTTVQDEFTDNFPSGDASVDHGDELTNTVHIEADTVLDTTNLQPTGATSAVIDDSAEELVISQGLTQKSIYAIHNPLTGDTTLNPSGTPEIFPGNIVTFRLRYEMPSTDFEDFSLSDYLPLPVLDATEVTSFDGTVSDGSSNFGSGIPNAGEAMWGPTGGGLNFADRLADPDTPNLLENGSTTPTITVPGGTTPAICGGTAIDSNENFVNFCFGDYDDPENQDSFIDVLFSVTVTDDPFADELFLTNLVRGQTGSTNSDGVASDEIVQFTLRQPVLLVKKGVIDSNNPNESFSETPNSSFAGAGDGGAPFTAPLESSLGGGNGGADNGTDADVNGLDADDLVRFAITIQNTGGSAAYDITLHDQLPAGLPASSVQNFNVTLGDGTPLGFTGSVADFFNPAVGIQINDPNEGACQSPFTDPAEAVIVISYDLQIDNTVAAGDILTNTTTVTNYAGSEGGPNHLDDPSLYPEDEASIEIAGTIDKEITRTSEADSSDTEAGIIGDERPVMIGEVITYRTYTRIAEGTSNNIQIRDNTPTGLQYISGTARFAFLSASGSSLTSTNGDINAANPGVASTDPTALASSSLVTVPLSAISGGSSSGDDLLVSFGDVTNGASDDEPEWIVLEFDMVVNNIPANQDGTVLENTATLRKSGADLITSDADLSDDDNDPVAVEIIEPDVGFSAKTMNETTAGSCATGTPTINTGDAGDEFCYFITISNNGSAPAYEVTLTDALPATYVTLQSTFDTVAGVAPTTTNVTGNTVTWGWDKLAAGATSTVAISVRVNDDVKPNDDWQNTATLEFTSLTGDQGTNDATPGNPGESTGERNGDDGVGGANNDYADEVTSPSFTVDEPTIVKQVQHPSETPISGDFGGSYLDSTDDTNTGMAEHDTNLIDLTIGEEFDYILTVEFPEGVTEGASIIDNASPYQTPGVTAVIELLEAEVVAIGNNLTGASLPAVNDTFTAQDGNGDSVGSTINIDLGTVTNAPDGTVTDDDRIVIRVSARIDSASASIDGETARNIGQIGWQEGASVESNSDSADVDIVEPDVAVTKTTVTGTDLQSGDTATFDLTVSSTGTAPAYNVEVTDTLPNDSTNAYLTFTAIDAANSTCDDAGGYNLTTNGFDVIVSFDELLPGDDCTLRINATVTDFVEPNTTYTNNVEVTSFDSRDDDTTDDNRNYTGGSDSDTFDTATIGITKAYLSTSETHTDDAQSGADNASEIPLAVGEVIQYELRVQLIEGTHAALSVTDALPAGLRAINDDAFTVEFPANVTTDSIDLASISGTGGTVSLYDSSGTLQAPNVVVSSGDTVELSLGNVTNADADSTTQEEIVITFNAQVLNTADANRSDELDNEASVDAGNSQATDTSNTIHARVYEPNVTISKAASPTEGDADDPITFTLTISNDNDTYSTTAFDLNVTDILPAGYANLVVNSIPTGATDNSGGTTLDVTIPSLAPDASVTIEYTADLATSVTPDEIIINTAEVTYTSLPGEQGTGDATPGNSGDEDGERNGSQSGENDYVDVATADVTVDQIQPEKRISATSADHTDNDSLPNDGSSDVPVAIGEVVTFQLVVTVPESTSDDVTMFDSLVSGLDYVPDSALVYTNSATSMNFADISGAVPNSAPGVPLQSGTEAVYDAGTRTLTINLGDITNFDDDENAEQVIVTFEAVVVDDAVNSLGQIWTNDFTVSVAGNDPVNSNEVSGIVVEPAPGITKSFSPTEQIRGGEVEMTLVVSNYAADGANAPIYDVRVTDILDDWLDVGTIANVDVVFNQEAQNFGSSVDTSASSITAGFAAGVTDDIIIDIDGLPVDGAATITVTMTIDPQANPLDLSREITNTATVTGDSLRSDVTPDDEQREYTDSASDTLDVVKPALLVTKIDSADPVAPGALMTYTVTVENSGTPDFDATNVLFEDEIPAGFVVTLVQPSQGTCAPIVGNVLTCQLGTIASGADANVVITGRYPAATPDGTIATNIAYVSSDEGNHGNDGNDTPDDGDDERAEEETEIARQADVSITKQVNDTSPNVGDLITFTLDVTNNGPSEATDVTVTDSLPNFLDYVEFTPSTLFCVYDGGTRTLTCDLGTLNVGQTRTIGIRATVDENVSAGTILINTATVFINEIDPDTSNNTDDATVTIDSADLSVTKTVDNPTPGEGDTIVYTVTVTNLGPADATSVEVTDVVPAGVAYVSDNSATLLDSAGNPTDFSADVWSIDALDANESLSLEITATVDPGASALTQPIVNTAELTASQPDDNNSNNDTDSADIYVGGLDLSLLKGVSDTTPDEGDTIVYSLIVENLSDVPATNIVVLDELDGIDVTYVSHSANRPGTTYTPGSGTWTIPSLSAGQSIRLDITVTVNTGTAGNSITNNASIDAVDQDDVNPDNDTDDATITVNTLDIAVAKSVDNPAPAEGDTVVWTVTVTNNGPSQATNLTISDTLPTGVSYDSDNSAASATDYDEGTGIWDIGTLNAGEVVTLEITTTVDTGTSGTQITNTASLDNVAPADSVSSNNTDDATISVGGLDLQVTKTVDQDVVSEGDSIIYTITVENLSQIDATGVEITDTLPANVTYDSDDSGGAYDDSTGVWNIGDLAASDSATLNITVTINQNVAGGTEITNTASLTSVDQNDSNPDNNEDDAVVTVGNVDLAVTKTVDNATPQTGDNVTYTITVTNEGTATATSITLSEDLPLDNVVLTYVSDNPSQGTFTAGTPGTWDIGTLQAGESATLQLTVTVNVADGSVPNVASISNVEPDDNNPDNDSDEANITLNGVDLSVSKTVDNATPNTGDTITYTIVARNEGASAATNVVVEDILPGGVQHIDDNADELTDDLGATTDYEPTTGNWTIGQLDPGSELTLTLEVEVVVDGGQVVNTAEITSNEPDADPSNNVDDATINVDSADLSLTKNVSTTSPQLGDTFTYTVTVRNDGPNIAYNVEVTDDLPTTVSYTGDYTASQGTFDGSVWTVGTIPVGGAASLDFTVELTDTSGTFVNVAEVTASDQADPDSTPDNGDSSEDDYDESGFLFDPPFGRKVFNADGLPELEWTIIWVNPNDEPLSISVSDPIVAGTTFIPGSLTCTSPGTVTITDCSFDVITREIVVDGTIFPDPGITPGTINNAQNPLIITYRVSVAEDVREVNNEAFLTSVNGDNVTVTSTWQRPDENEDTPAPVTEQQPGEITLTKYAEPEIAFPGETLTWILEVTNPGDVNVTGISVTDQLPDALSIESTEADKGTVNIAGQGVTWDVGTLGPNETFRLRIITRVSPDIDAPVTNTAFVTGDNVTVQEASATANYISSLPSTGETPTLFQRLKKAASALSWQSPADSR